VGELPIYLLLFKPAMIEQRAFASLPMPTASQTGPHIVVDVHASIE
jgi:hypothetical protein